MNDLELDPAIAKLLEYAKAKKSISFDELSDFLPEHVLNSEKIDGILALLESNNIQLEEEEVQVEDEVPVKEEETEKKRLVYNDKESSVDDPIRLYLREIGKENLLTAEQEVELSKQMEEGENIIKGIIKKSGVLVSEFYAIAIKATRREAKDSSLQRKENTEKIAERRRLNQFYRDVIRDCLPDLKDYMEQKRKLIARGGNLFEDKELETKRIALLERLKQAEIHPEEINSFSEKFISSSKKIRKYRKEQEKLERVLQISSMRELRTLGRSLTVKEKREEIEETLGLSSDDIKEKIRQVQVTDKKLKELELVFESDADEIITMDPSIDPRGSGWNILQSITAIGSGGFLGKGFLQGTQSHYRYLPQQSTDFIFSIIAEEWGFFGGFIVFSLFFVLMHRCVGIMKTVRDHYALYVVAGITGMIFFHFLINVGMVMGIMPITGIPLFFLSYGGSSLWVILIAMGLVLGISARRYRMGTARME